MTESHPLVRLQTVRAQPVDLANRISSIIGPARHQLSERGTVLMDQTNLLLFEVLRNTAILLNRYPERLTDVDTGGRAALQ
jgi:hypothetical protein